VGLGFGPVSYVFLIFLLFTPISLLFAPVSHQNFIQKFLKNYHMFLDEFPTVLW